MKMIHAMFSAGLGGIEQAFIDYAHLLGEYDCLHLVDAHAQITAQLPAECTHAMKQHSQYDLRARQAIKRLVAQHQPNAILAHGKRAVMLCYPAAKKYGIPLIGVMHNEAIKHADRLDAAIAVSRHIEAQLQGRVPVCYVPNMMDASQESALFDPSNITLGAMGRLHPRKGMDVWLDALSMLEVPFNARLAGEGEARAALIKQQEKLGLQATLSFEGWVQNKHDFFHKIGIFCLPSRTESFGLSMLEAMHHQVPVIATDCVGPQEICTHEQDALLVEKENPHAFSQAIKRLMEDADLRARLVKNASQTVGKYSAIRVKQQLIQALEQWV